jgi:hypothetical protein
MLCVQYGFCALPELNASEYFGSDHFPRALLAVRVDHFRRGVGYSAHPTKQAVE